MKEQLGWMELGVYGYYDKVAMRRERTVEKGNIPISGLLTEPYGLQRIFFFFFTSLQVFIMTVPIIITL